MIDTSSAGVPKWYDPSEASRAEKKMVAFDLLSRGYNAADLERKLGIAHATALKYRKEWMEQYTQQSIDDPLILNRVIENVHRMLDELNTQYREAWEIYNDPSCNNKDRVAAMRLAKDISQQKSQILHLTDIKVEIVNQTQKAFAAQQQLIAILQDPNIICEGCRGKVIKALESVGGNGDRPLAIEGETVSEVFVEEEYATG